MITCIQSRNFRNGYRKIKFLERNSERVFVAFNNHFGAQAVINARMLKKLLSGSY